MTTRRSTACGSRACACAARVPTWRRSPRRYEADTLVLALPNAEAATLRDLAARAADAGLDVVSLPPLKDIIGGRPTPNDLRDLDVADLLGRRPVQLDTTAIADQISGRRVLVTGAGGSIGSELCRQIARFGPSRLYMLDRDESGLQATEMTLSGHGLLDSDDLILADIRDPKALADAFDRARPEVVFHAAALKHLPLLEAHPLEAWKSNVIGHPQRPDGRRGCRRLDVRQHLDRQGRQPDVRARLQQAARRASDR